ncbi:hypothetical protein KM043_017261 [Ampulex compressa]|nr:hypothetical protein KM043_017261 [Ampulex compressa]
MTSRRTMAKKYGIRLVNSGSQALWRLCDYGRRACQREREREGGFRCSASGPLPGLNVEGSSGLMLVKYQEPL